MQEQSASAHRAGNTTCGGGAPPWVEEKEVFDADLSVFRYLESLALDFGMF